MICPSCVIVNVIGVVIVIGVIICVTWQLYPAVFNGLQALFH